MALIRGQLRADELDRNLVMVLVLPNEDRPTPPEPMRPRMWYSPREGGSWDVMGS